MITTIETPPKTIDQLEHEIALFEKQEKALASKQAMHLRPDERNTLSAYYTEQILKRTAKIAREIKAAAESKSSQLHRF